MEFNNIQITHFVNPHKFWFKTTLFDIKFIEFDIKLQKFLKIFDPIGGNIYSDTNEQDIFDTDQVVAYFDPKWQRWFRGTIQTNSSASEIGLFLLDFGFPIVTNVKLIRKIPIEFQCWVNENIKYGAINQILPATAELDVALFDIQMSITEDWSSNAINVAQKIITESCSICFTADFDLNSQLFGKLYAIRANANVKQEISTILIKLQHAVFIENITNKFSNRPVSCTSNVSNNFSRCTSPMTGAGELCNDIETSTPKSSKTEFPATIQINHQFWRSELLSKPETKSITKLPNVLNNEANSSTLVVDTNKSGLKISSVDDSIKLDDQSTVHEPCKLCRADDDDLSISNIKSSQISMNQSEICLNNNARTRKMSDQSENSNFSGTRSILEYSESDIDTCISASPHLAKLLNKMRNIKKKDQTKLNTSIAYNSTKLSTVLQTPADINNQNMLSIEKSNINKQIPQSDNFRENIITEYFKVELLTNNAKEICTQQSNNSPSTTLNISRESSIAETSRNTVNGKLLENANESNKNVETRETFLDTSKMPSDNSSLATSTINSTNSVRHSNSVDNEFPYTSNQENNPENSETYSKIVNGESSMDSNNKSIENFESREPRLNMKKVPSDTSSITTSTIKSNDSAQHSNSADNEFSSPSNLENKSDINYFIKIPHQKLYTKKPSDQGNKYEKSSDASNSDTSLKNRPAFMSFGTVKLKTNKKYTFFEKEQKHSVLVHGHTAINPVESLEQVNFSKNIHYALDQLGNNRLFRIDSYTWPHCLNGTSFVVIGAEKTGKTISYLPSLINLILMEEEDNGIIDGVGPIALIVAPTSEKVANIFEVCKSFNAYLDNKLTICKGHGIPNDKLAMSLLNGVHILISTPECLDRLFDSSVYLINPERLKFFVIEDYHLMTNRITLIKKIIRSSCVINPETELYEQQIIVTSVYWHNTFMAMLNKTNNSFICIGSYMESAYYAKQDIKLLFMRQEDKLNKLNEILSNKDYRLNHTLIVCRDSTDVESIVKYLSDWSLDVIGCSRQDSSEMTLRIINEWNDRNNCSLKIVVCTDEILPELHLNRIKVLIHFSLSITWSKFQYRYSTFFESMPNLLKKESLETKSIVFIDETNNSELPRFIDFLKIHGVKNINPAIEHLSDEIRNQKEVEKEENHVDFCKYILKFGTCRQQNVCQYRHRFTNLDKPIIQLATKKYIKFTVAHVYSPAHFSVSLTGTRDSLNDPWTEFDKTDYKIFNIKFKLYYSTKKNHMQHPSCNKGDLCTLNIHEKFYRCKIINVGEKRGVLSDRRVVVKAIDIGQILNLTESRLLLLPDQFKTIPAKLVDMRLGGLIPIDNDIKWPYESTCFVQNYFAKQERKKELFLEASLSFIITETIFVDSIVFKRDLGKFGGGELEVRNFKTDLIKNEIGISDEESFNCAKELLRAADFEVFELKIQPKIEQNKLCPSSLPIENFVVTPTTRPQTPLKEEDSVTIPSIAEKPMLTENKNSDPHSNFEKNIAVDESRTNFLSEASVSNKKSSTRFNKPLTHNIKLGVSLPNKIEHINLCFFKSPMVFFVQKIASLSVINTRLFDIRDYLIETNQKKFENFMIGDICLVFYDGYYDRAEIIAIDKDEVFVNICDLGFTLKYSKNDLYDVDDAIKIQPFEAIECQLFGLKPIGDDAGSWDEKCIDDIYDYINDNYTDHYVKKMTEVKRDQRPKFSVMLCGFNGDNGMEIINKVLVEKGWAEYNEEVRDVFEQSCNGLVAEFKENVMIHNNNSDEFDEDAFSNSFSYEQCIEMFNFPGMMPSAKITEITDGPIILDKASNKCLDHKAIMPSAKITEITEDISKDFELPNNSIDQVISYGNDPPPLVSCYNLLPLETLWHQDATTITLKINVTDHVDYRIEVHKRLINVCVYFDDQTYREITINLFGVINIDNFVNMIIGNYLKIVLMKSIQMNLLWPRLLLLDRKLSWLHYNYDSLKDTDSKDDDYIQYKIKRMDSSSDTDSDEQLDEDDECDPLSTQYNFVENKYFDENQMKMINDC